MALTKTTDRIIYGPVSSRRLNRSLGINLLPVSEKLCNFDCVYCQFGITKDYYDEDEDYDFPSLSTVESEIARYIAGIGEPREYIDYITFSGNGEPTLYPKFAEVVRTVTTIRDEMVPKVSTAVLSNGSTLLKDEIRDAMLLIDYPVVKLDCGNEETFRKLNRPDDSIKFDDIVSGIKNLKNSTIQTLFITSKEVDNSTDEEVKSWIDVLKGLDIREVQIYTIERSPAEKWVEEISEERLNEIAKLAESELKRPVKVYM